MTEQIIGKEVYERYCEICELIQKSFNPKCYDNDGYGEEPQVCRKCHARFCCECRLKPFLEEFIDLKWEVC